MATLTITPIRGRFPHARPRPARRGMGNGGSLLATATAPFTLGSNIASYLWNMPATGYPSLDAVKAANAQATIQASTDPNTGEVNWNLANAQIAAANAQMDAAYQSGMQTPSSTFTGLPQAPSLSDALGISATSGSSGISLSSILGSLSSIAIIAAIGIGGYFFYKAVK